MLLPCRERPDAGAGILGGDPCRPGRFGKLDRYGSVAVGKAADLVLLERDPLQDAGATRAIDAVLLRGRVCDRKALDGVLDAARRKVAVWNAAAAR